MPRLVLVESVSANGEQAQTHEQLQPDPCNMLSNHPRPSTPSAQTSLQMTVRCRRTEAPGGADQITGDDLARALSKASTRSGASSTPTVRVKQQRQLHMHTAREAARRQRGGGARTQAATKQPTCSTRRISKEISLTTASTASRIAEFIDEPAGLYRYWQAFGVCRRHPGAGVDPASLQQSEITNNNRMGARLVGPTQSSVRTSADSKSNTHWKPASSSPEQPVARISAQQHSPDRHD